MQLTYSDVRAILELIDASEHLNEVEIIYNGLRLHVVRTASGSLVHDPLGVAAARSSTSSTAESAREGGAPQAPAAGAAPAESIPEGVVAVRAPMLGTFYRAAAPGERPFVELGQRVLADDIVCLIEVMKLFNSIRAGVDGEVVTILVENGGLVEHNQALMLIAPAGQA